MLLSSSRPSTPPGLGFRRAGLFVLTKVRHLSFARRTGGQPFLLDRNTFISITERVLYFIGKRPPPSFLGAGAIALPRR